MYAVGAIIVGLPVVVLSSVVPVRQLFRLQLKSRSAVEQEDQLRTYLCQHGVSMRLRKKIWMAVRASEEKSQYMVESGVQLMAHLPPQLATKLRAEVFIPILT